MSDSHSRIFGVGTGLFVVVFFWAIAIVVFTFTLKSRGFWYAGVAVLAATSLLTGILFAVPRGDVVQDKSKDQILYDDFFILRTAILVLLAVTFFSGIGIVFVTHWMEPVLAKPLKKTS